MKGKEEVVSLAVRGDDNRTWQPAIHDTVALQTIQESLETVATLDDIRRIYSITETAKTKGKEKRYMQYELLYPGTFTMLKVNLDKGEGIKAESGSMIAMSNTVDVEGKMEGGILGGLGRMLTGESFFLQSLKANRGAGEALLAHSVPGDIFALEMDGSMEYILQKDGFLAGSENLAISTKVQNLAKGLFSGEGFFVVRISGEGMLFVSSFGRIHPLDIPAGDEIVIDNAHLVAWPGTIHYSIEKSSSGWISSITSGEGLVCRFRGPGRVLIQTRNPAGFGAWVRQFIPTRSS